MIVRALGSLIEGPEKQKSLEITSIGKCFLQSSSVLKVSGHLEQNSEKKFIFHLIIISFTFGFSLSFQQYILDDDTGHVHIITLELWTTTTVNCTNYPAEIQIESHTVINSTNGSPSII